MDKVVFFYFINCQTRDAIGLVMVISDKSDVGQLEEKLVNVIAQFLGKHVEE